jgi:hypothetical protein
VLYSHELGSTGAKYTVQLGQSNNFLYTVSYQQIKTWSLLSEGHKSKSWEKVWANWNCLSLVTSHVVGTCRVEHKTPQDNQSKSWKKCDLCLFCHWSLLMPLAPAGQSIQLFICHISRRRLCHRSLQDNQSKSWEKVWLLVLLLLGMVSMTPGTS